MWENLSEQAREQCLQRMAVTLSFKPKRRKHQEYLRSLAGKPESVHSLRKKAEAAKSRRETYERAREVAKGIVANLKSGVGVTQPYETRAPDKRLDRVRPSARRAIDIKKNCRGESRFRRVERLFSPQKVSRDMATVYSQRRALHDAQNGTCSYCARRIHDVEDRQAATLDHVIPRSERGFDGLGNYLLVHGQCNSDKSNDFPTGCEMVALLAVNARLGVLPVVF